MPPFMNKRPLDHYVIQCANTPALIQSIRDLTGWQEPVVSDDGLQVRWGAFASSVPDEVLLAVEQMIGVSEFLDDLPLKTETRSRVEGGFKVGTR